MIDLTSKYLFKKFSKEQRSSFTYWYYHLQIFLFILATPEDNNTTHRDVHCL